MRIHLLAFASASEAIGAPERDYRLPTEEGPPTVSDLKAALSEDFPQVKELWQRLAVSIDGEIVSDAEALHEGAEVALLPPVSGG